MNASTRIIAMVLVVLAVVLGVLALFVGRRPPPISGMQSNAAPPIPMYPVVVAARALDAGQAIDADGVRVVQLPVQPTGSFPRTQDVIGHIPRVAIPSGLPLTESGLNQGLPLALKTGERGVAIPVDEVVGVGNGVQAGDYVDVFYSARAPGLSNSMAAVQGADRSVARLLLARIRVLAYGADSLAPNTATTSGNGVNRDAMHAQARSAVLAVPVADVDQLVLATQTGKLTLALRFPEDKQLPDAALFVQPPRALTVRAGLTTTQSALLTSAENTAYAGLDSLSLVGQGQNGDAARVPPLPAAAINSRTGNFGGNLSGNLSSNGSGAAFANRPRKSAGLSEGFVEVIRGADIKREAADSHGAASGAALGGGVQ